MKWEKDYGYKYPLKAYRYANHPDGGWEINVRQMRQDEMPDDGIVYYCDEDGTIYNCGEEDFTLLTN